LAYPLRKPDYLRVELLDTFWDSFLLLDLCQGTFAALMELLFVVSTRPETVPPLEGKRVRLLLTTPESGLPPLRLFFFIENGAVQVIQVDQYGDFEP
jgi:hypothetical protein